MFRFLFLIFCLFFLAKNSFARNRFEFDLGIGWPTRYVLNENISDESIIDRPYDNFGNSFDFNILKIFISSFVYQAKYSFINKENMRLKVFLGGHFLNFTIDCNECQEAHVTYHTGFAFGYGNPFEVELQLGLQYSDYDIRKPHGGTGLLYGIGFTYYPPHRDPNPEIMYGIGLCFQKIRTNKDNIKTSTDVLMFKITMSPFSLLFK